MSHKGAKVHARCKRAKKSTLSRLWDTVVEK
jgi:hypothetical protein